MVVVSFSVLFSLSVCLDDWKSTGLSTVFNLQAAHRELVICVLPLILSMFFFFQKISIEGTPVKFHCLVSSSTVH